MDKFKIISYNCRSVNSSTDVIISLLNICDILFLQETLITEHNSYLLDNLHRDFHWFYVPSNRDENNLNGRASGGLVILYKKYTGIHFSEVFISKRTQGIAIQSDNISYLLVNVYLICDYRNDESYIEYVSSLSELSNSLNQTDFDHVLILGDFNCDPNKGRFFSEFKNFYTTNNLIPYDIVNLPLDSFTYISSNDTFSTSWLDHLLASEKCEISNFTILYDFALEDHIPVYFEIDLIKKEFLPAHQSVFDENKYVLWNKVSDEDIHNYRENLDYFLSDLDSEVLKCRNESCTNETHSIELNNLYSFLVDSIGVSSSFLPNRSYNDSFSPVAGWNDYCKELYDEARDNFKIWKLNGSVRSGSLFKKMKMSRNSFKTSLKFCRNNEIEIKKNKLLQNFSNKCDFWKEVKKLSPKKTIPNCIDGLSKPKEILEVFDQKYKSILNDPTCQSNMNHGNGGALSGSSGFPVFIGVEKLNNSIEQLKPGIGWDGVHSFHIKYGSLKFKRFICNLFNKLISHKFVPKEMLKGEIRPVLKGGSAGKHSSSNYRPVMNSSCFLKLYEYCFVPYLDKFLKISDRQFGFRPNTGCLAAVSVLKETVFRYMDGNSPVHCAFLDLTKAFDRVNFKILIDKLNSSNLPPSIVNNIDFMLHNSWVHTKFLGISSDEWLIGNGVRQGGVLSSYLFNFYINSLIEEVSDSGIGCFLNNRHSNIICYADDIALLAPTASGLQILVNMVTEVLSELCLRVNNSKSSYVVFHKKKSLGTPGKILLLGEEMKKTSDCKYLGTILNERMRIESDCERVTKTFFGQFYSFYSKFYYANNEILYFLFRSYTTSFYGIELWYNFLENKNVFKKCSIAYHGAIKKLCKMNKWDSNHEACFLSNQQIFNHLLVKRTFRFYLSLINSKSPCLKDFKYYFRFQSVLYSRVRSIFDSVYGVRDIFDNPICAIMSRIDFIERNEERSSYHFRN